MLLGAFFDVQNLKEVAGSRWQQRDPAPTQPARRQPTPGFPGQRRRASAVLRPGDRAVDAARRRRNLEEEKSPGRNMMVRCGNTPSITNPLTDEGLEDDDLGSSPAPPAMVVTGRRSRKNIKGASGAGDRVTAVSG